MDQNSTNGAGADKRNWRERLGVGSKELPKISNEFRAAPAMQAPPAGSAKPAPRAPQPVTRPAPMAPRAPVKSMVTPAAAPPAPTPRVIDNKAQDVLADKLRAQRAAAEKLAEQRVLAARERAEAKIVTSPAAAAEPKFNMPPRAASQAPAPRPAATPPLADAASRPKFSFAEDDAVVRKEPRADGLVPPRPALVAPPLQPPPRPVLGGERVQPPFLRPSAPAPAGRQMPPYRPIDPATGYAPPSRYTPPRGTAADAPAYGTARPPVRRPPAIDPYGRQGDQRPYPPEAYEDDPRAGPRLSRPPAPRGRARPSEPEEEFDEVFEEAVAPQRQRASARDYQNAYRETEGGYEEDQRRSSGPWLLLLALLVGAAIAGGVFWYYKTKMTAATATPPSTTSSETVPLVEAPQDPAKTAPEQPPEAQSQAPAAVKKKLIYDRIVGDQEVPGDQVMPTEEIPVQPAASAEPPAAEIPAATQIPAPDAPENAAPADGGLALPAPDETAPLPLPPPPSNDQQGSLDKTGMEKIAAAAAQPEQGSTAPPPPVVAVTETATDTTLPPPEPASDGAALVSGAEVPPAGSTAAEAAKTAEPAAPAPAKPVKKKETAKAAKKKTVAEPKAEDLGTEPVVLVPPSQPVPPSQGSEVAAGEPVSQQGAAPEPVKKKKTLLDLFSTSSENTETPAQVAAPEQTQTASLPPKTTAAPAPEPEPAPAPAAKPASGTGYVVQLSSFSSQSEAQTEYGRLSSLYPTVVGGLPQRVAEAKVGGSTRFQLGLGPVKTRADATRVCSALFQAGERDCIVRSQ